MGGEYHHRCYLKFENKDIAGAVLSPVILLGLDCFNGALLNTGTAIRARIRINFINGVALADGLHGTDINATPTGYTGICDLMSH